MKNLFEEKAVNEILTRIAKLSPESQAQWGKMNLGQMMAHLNVSYDYVYSDKYSRPKGLKKWALKTFVKPMVVGEKTYKKNLRTAPDFVITDIKEFEAEKKKLLEHIKKTQELGAQYFDGKDSHSFGPLSEKEWNAMFYKHLDHHLKQFGV